MTSCATVPTILVTVRITIQRVTCMLLSPNLLKLLLKLSEFLSQISHLIGFPAAYFLPGLFG